MQDFQYGVQREYEGICRALSSIDLHEVLLPYAVQYAQPFKIGVLDGVHPVLPGDITDPVRSPLNADIVLYFSDITV